MGIKTSFGQTDASNKGVEVQVVSWNIQMLPNALGIFSSALRKKQRIRAPWIIEHCLNAPYDVIVFQEVFDRDIKRKLKKGLKEMYPYQVDTRIEKGRLTSNGIFIVSKIPMKYIDHVIYAKGAHEDAWAAKGCTLVEVEKEGFLFQIAGTHLQSGGSTAAEKFRALQYQDIRTLLDKHANEKVPVLVMGDMNTRKSNAPKYTQMIETIGVKDYPLNEEEPYTIDNKNSWNTHSQGIQLDYVLLQARATQTNIYEQKVLRLKAEHKGKQIDLADHYGIVATVELLP
ncbi:endonuclease/exonuclease/phosphatase family protein [Aureispira sp. CCB-QB1]|uniref:endonuclease/exonuclease/phosphatase family protein n=1 Tax=Aureispira sp. CCB-QB1 TaxID=1313421 RepID=UPI000698ECC5|nr:endonuclease/exonuclease/phosphatase family protein [Aureispira sp. CCB-QB1]